LSESFFFFLQKAKKIFNFREKQIAQRKKEHKEKRKKKAGEGLINAGGSTSRSNTEEEGEKSDRNSVIEDPPINLKEKNEKKEDKKPLKNSCLC